MATLSVPDTPPNAADEQAKSTATELKAKANERFAEKAFEEAIDLYSLALVLDPTSAVLFSNRAFCHFKLENYGLCLADADKAIGCDPKYVKGYYRRGSALLALGKYKEGLKDFRTVVRIAPSDRDAQAKLKACEAEVRRLAFEAAIGCADEPRKITCLDVRYLDVAVEDAYEGPRTDPENGVTLAFVEAMTAHMAAEKKVHRRFVMEILQKAYHMFSNEPTVFDVSLPASKKLTVCGDTHGQFYDLLNIFRINGVPSEANPYVFNGDFVDRGSFSVEVVVTLLAYKVACPTCMYLTRGNHETMNMNKMYGFDGEVLAKYNDTLLHMFREVFEWLPLACVIEAKVFVCHGGLFSKDGVTLADLRAIQRNREPPDEGLMTELLWSDPQPEAGRGASKRGVGVQFGPDVTRNFLETNGLTHVIRSHECKPLGYEVHHDGRCITVFSAPNYCDQMGNKGAFITFDERMLPKFTTFDEVPHPNIRPMAYATQFGSLFM